MSDPTSPATAAVTGPLSPGELATDDLLAASHLLAGHQLPGLLEAHADRLGLSDPLMYLVDLQQEVLVPFRGPHGQGAQAPSLSEVLSVDGTLAGRCYQHVELLTQQLPDGAARLWLPLLNGTERLGVLTVVVPDPSALHADDGALAVRLRRLAVVLAELVTSRAMYGDAIVRVRRTQPMGLAAEMQRSPLPPLTFACDGVTVAGALEPAYEVAGDTVDYAVDALLARVGMFDGMGHGLHSAQLAALATAAYRHARRAGQGLVATLRGIDEALLLGFGGETFSTAVLAELDTGTGELQWVSAGHPAPLLLRDGRLVKTLDVDPVPPLGLGHTLGPDALAAEVPVGREHLEPGDRVLFYTDGVTDARSPDGDFFGQDRLVDLLTRNLAGGLPTPETMRRVVRALLTHQQGQLTDDATMLLVEWGSPSVGEMLPTGGPGADRSL